MVTKEDYYFPDEEKAREIKENFNKWVNPKFKELKTRRYPLELK